MAIFKLSLFCFLSLVFVKCSSPSANNSPEENLKTNKSMEIKDYTPSYISLHKEGVLKKRGKELWDRMESCDLCPRNCGVNRLEGERGFCKANSDLEVASATPHYGEEPELVGRGGSGTIFFTNCALLCVFCINSEISQGGAGRKYSIEDLADMMIALQKRGCHNINFVTPTHYSPHIVLALDKAVEKGLKVPTVYNTCGWEKPDVLKYLDGIIDIYLTDFKYGCNEKAGKYSIGAYDYVDYAQKAHLEIQRQVGTAKKDQKTGLMQKGLMIRHLVMPNNVACSKEVMEWIAENLPKNTYINIMSQYTPVFKAPNYPDISRRITREEYREAIKSAEEAGLTNIQTQGYR